MVPPKTRDVIRGLRKELHALDLAIATFERLEKLREKPEKDHAPGMADERVARKRPRRGSSTPGSD